MKAHDENPSHKLTGVTGLYTDESPGLKVDPFVVMVLSIGFIISVVALHSKHPPLEVARHTHANRVLVLAKLTKRFSS